MKLILFLVLKAWKLYQLDVKNIFLNDNLKKEMYMIMSFRYDKSNKCCKLKKVLYRLKQSTRAWFDKHKVVMIKKCYNQGNEDHIVFVKRTEGPVVVLFIHDDMIATSEDGGEFSN